MTTLLGAAPAPPSPAQAALPFKASAPLSLGVELELAIIDPAGLDLAPAATILVAALARDGYGQHVKAEITDAMIEINSSPHHGAPALRAELAALASTLVTYAERFGLGVCGGGTHPFQEWADRTIYPTRRFREVSRTYGYMAQQFTVFGQHVHVGVASGDDAIWLTHAFARWTPHLIALAAASPYWRGVDTGFDCCRLNVVNAFPMSGLAPSCRSWAEFEQFYATMRRSGVVGSMKDFYWDVRPKPEFGTVEIRVCDTPLAVADAADLAALAQALAAELLDGPRDWPVPHFERLYARNRFTAARYGLQGEVILPDGSAVEPIARSLLQLLERLAPRFAALGSADARARLQQRIAGAGNDAAWLRQRFAGRRDLAEVVRAMAGRLLAAGDG